MVELGEAPKMFAEVGVVGRSHHEMLSACDDRRLRFLGEHC